MCLEQNGYLTSNQRPHKHNCNLIEPSNFEWSMILLKKLAFCSHKHPKVVKNGQLLFTKKRLEVNVNVTSNRRPQKHNCFFIELTNFE